MEKLGWKPEISFQELVADMVYSDMEKYRVLSDA
jgi:GDP-D-mannose dehydratase